MATSLEVAAPQCVAEDFDGEIVILNMDDGIYYSVHDAGAEIWRDLAAGHPVDTLTGLASGDERLAKAIEAFSADLVDKGLMRPAVAANGPDAPPTLDIERMGAGALPALESYADMQSLLMLCPVHEDGPDGAPPASLSQRVLSKLGSLFGRG